MNRSKNNHSNVKEAVSHAVCNSYAETHKRHNPKRVNWETMAFTKPGAKIHHEIDYISITKKFFHGIKISRKWLAMIKLNSQTIFFLKKISTNFQTAALRPQLTPFCAYMGKYIL